MSRIRLYCWFSEVPSGHGSCQAVDQSAAPRPPVPFRREDSIPKGVPTDAMGMAETAPSLLGRRGGLQLLMVALLMTFSGLGRSAAAQEVVDSGISRPMAVVAVPATDSGGDVLALFLSGDGGWVGIDKQMARTLAAGGVAVIGVNLKAYLGSRRTPGAVAADVSRVLRQYLAAWDRSRIVVVGYSRGADIAPFLVNRLPRDLKDRVLLVAMLGLGEYAGFHVGFLNLFRKTTNPSDFPVRPELEQLQRAGVRMLCIFGTEERESLCRDAPEGLMIKLAKPGGHHFDGDNPALATAVLAQLFAPE